MVYELFFHIPCFLHLTWCQEYALCSRLCSNEFPKLVNDIRIE